MTEKDFYAQELLKNEIKSVRDLVWQLEQAVTKSNNGLTEEVEKLKKLRAADELKIDSIVNKIQPSFDQYSQTVASFI